MRDSAGRCFIVENAKVVPGYAKRLNFPTRKKL